MLAPPSSGVRDIAESRLPGAVSSAARSIPRPTYIAGLLLFGLLVLQYSLFRQYAVREATWAHPTATDQNVYLQASYEDHEKMLRAGFLRGAWQAVWSPTPNGVMLPAQGAILYLFIGASRLSALTLLFLYFVLSEIVFVWTIWWLTRSWAFTASALSLFLLSTSRFYLVGSLFDFRIDSIAASLYFITIALAVRSGMFRSRGFSVLCGATAGMLVLFRFVAITYTAGLFAVTAAAFTLMYLCSKTIPELSAEWKVRAVNSVLCLAGTGAIAAPMFLHNVGVIFAYYGSHVGSGSEKALREAEQGVGSLITHLLYYPNSLYRDHLGWPYISGVLLFAAIVAASVRWRRGWPIAGFSNAETRQMVAALVFCAFAIAIPLGLFTIDIVKTPVVAGVFVGPITFFLVLLGILLMRAGFWDEKSLAAGSAILAIFAICHEVTAVSHHSMLIGSRSEEANLLSTYKQMIDYARAAGWKTIHLANDRVTDYGHPQNLTVMQYEWTGELYPVQSTLGNTNFEMPRDRVISALAASDFALLTIQFARDSRTFYPFDKEMIAMRQEIWNETQKRMLLLRTLTYNEHVIAVFARLGISVMGASGDWLTANGASLGVPCSLLEGKRTLVASGDTIFSEMIGNSLNATAKLNAEQPLRATVSPVTNHYSIAIDLRNADTSHQGSCSIALAFDRYFVPKDKGINADTRKLVVQAPTDFKFE